MSPAVHFEVLDDDDPLLQPVYGPPCGVGPTNHRWSLTIQEGRICLTSRCDECDSVVLGPVGGEDVTMEVEIDGTLTSHLERFGWETPEYDHWWEFHPARIASSPVSNRDTETP